MDQFFSGISKIAYRIAVTMFLTWCEEYGVPLLGDVQPLHMPLA